MIGGSGVATYIPDPRESGARKPTSTKANFVLTDQFRRIAGSRMVLN